jgi:hypothetical protein
MIRCPDCGSLWEPSTGEPCPGCQLSWDAVREAARFLQQQAERAIAPVTDIPRWKRGDLADRLKNHMSAEAIFERQVGDVTQIVERVVLADRPTQDCRPFYRLVEIKDGNARAIHTLELKVAYTQREVRAAADRRARRHLRRAAA